jgi:hypothetical protein
VVADVLLENNVQVSVAPTVRLVTFTEVTPLSCVVASSPEDPIVNVAPPIELNVAPPSASWKSTPATERVATSRFGCEFATLPITARLVVRSFAGATPPVQLAPKVQLTFPAESAQLILVTAQTGDDRHPSSVRQAAKTRSGGDLNAREKRPENWRYGFNGTYLWGVVPLNSSNGAIHGTALGQFGLHSRPRKGDPCHRAQRASYDSK